LNNKNNKETLSMARNEVFFFKILEDRRQSAPYCGCEKYKRKKYWVPVLGRGLGLRGAELSSKFN